MQKESPRAREFEGFYSHYFAGDFALRRYRNSTRRYSATPEREFESQFPLFPLDSKKTLSSLFQFSPVCPILLPVSIIAENPWGQIWVTVFRVIRGNFTDHGGSRETASTN